MLRKPSHWLPALALGATLVAAAAAGAADTTTGGASPRAQMMARFQEKLGLSDDQVKAIQDVQNKYAASRKQTWQALRQKQGELRQLALNGGDSAAIQAKSAEVSQLLAQSLTLRVQSLQEIAPLLNQDQRDKLAQMHMGPRMHRHHGVKPQGS
jgi:Spy/CpxP family protein refolding chaperone